MESIEYHLNWLAPLAPEISMLPEDSIFQVTNQEYSLTAIFPGQPGLLFASPDTLIEIADWLYHSQAVEHTPQIIPITPEEELATIMNEDNNSTI